MCTGLKNFECQVVNASASFASRPCAAVAIAEEQASAKAGIFRLLTSDFRLVILAKEQNILIRLICFPKLIVIGP